MKTICITGHRNCNLTNDAVDVFMNNIIKHYGKIMIVSGGAEGFDLLIENWCINNNVILKTIRPDYNKNFYKQAPLERNKIMVDMCDFVLAYYDGRKTGGTYYTINYARKKNKQIMFIQ